MAQPTWGVQTRSDSLLSSGAMPKAGEVILAMQERPPIEPDILDILGTLAL